MQSVASSPDASPTGDALRRRLAEIGVPLFEPTPTGSTRSAVGPLLVALLRSGDPRLLASIPCALAATANSPVGVPSDLSGSEQDRLGLLHYAARCLATSRSPDLTQLFGKPLELPPSTAEPAGLPDPAESFGKRGLAAASERDPQLVGDAIRLFDQWLRIQRLERRTREPARTR